MDNDSLPEQPFISHLVELRDRVLRMILGVAVVLLVLLPFANTIYTTFASPLVAALPQGEMVAVGVLSPFLVPIKLCLFLALCIALPWVLYQLWAFVAPGLYRHEKQMVMPLVVSSTVLFYLGMAFAYFVVLPIFSLFIVATTPDGVRYFPDINYYLGFVLTLFFAFGVAFEVPIATFLLVMSGATDTQTLRGQRPYIIVGAFVVGMLLTPPDVISQTLLALPMWVLFEVGLILSDVIGARRAATQGDAEDELD